MKYQNCILLIFLTICHLPSALADEPIYGEGPRTGEPTLMIEKYVSDDSVLLNEYIFIYVNITNISRDYAYNLTIKEPVLNPNVFNTSKFHIPDVVIIGWGPSIYLEYNITTDVVGKYIIEPTTIEYFDSDGFTHFAKSGYIEIEYRDSAIPEEVTSHWRNLLSLTIMFVAVPIAIFYFHKFRS